MKNRKKGNLFIVTLIAFTQTYLSALHNELPSIVQVLFETNLLRLNFSSRPG